jgi:putative membrane-bound dehydrogenase-like protein
MSLPRSRQFVVSVLAACFVLTLSVFARTQGGGSAQPPTAQGGQTPQGRAAPGQGAAGGRGGRGAPMWEPDFSKKPPVVALSPADQQKKFWLPPGFRIEPVLTDPDIEEPAQIAFDGNGRMFVLELRGYMQDADATGELDPVGRISVHEDKNNDGVYETHKIFVDHLIFPRFVMPFGGNAILAKESNADEVWKYTDTNNDSVADKKELFATGLGRLLNVEHQESGFFWALDNWIYSTINPVRIRWTPNGVLREPTGSNGGQWGATQDNYGKVWFQAGASGMPGYFQLPIQYGNFPYPEQFEPDLNITWGAPVLIADMQGGMNAVRMPDGSLARATGAAGNDVFRGDKLPKELVGDYFYGEVVARIVRRLQPVKTEGLTQLKNAYPLSEFLRSTDPLFRPVDVTTAPDGTMYITDMYRGIIQESQWSGPGTYLRQRIEQYALDKIVRRGRIWRVSYEGMPRRTTPPRMLSETPAQLVRHLSDPNGWWRDTAQQLIVLSQDKSVVPALKQLARTSPNQLARIHALWTLEGLSSADATLIREMLKDADPQIRMQAVRASETLYKAGDRSFANDYMALTKERDADVVMQALMTLNTLKVPEGKAAISMALDANKAKGVQLVANAILKPAAGRGGFSMMEGIMPYTSEERAVLDKGQEIYTQVCFACHGDDGRGAKVPGAQNEALLGPPLASSPRVLGHQNYVINTVLHGLTGPLDGATYPDVMIGMGQNSDEWVAAITSYIRNSFGNRAAFVSPDDVKRVRAATAGRKGNWNTAELMASLPRQIVVDPAWKLTASHNSETAVNALSINPWTSGRAQEPGMWLQVELPQPAMVTEIACESTQATVQTGPAVRGAPTRTGGQDNRDGMLGFPIAYQVQVSMDGTSWTPVAEGKGSGSQTTIAFAPTRAKFVRLTQTGSAENAAPLSIRRLRLFTPGTLNGDTQR